MIINKRCGQGSRSKELALEFSIPNEEQTRISTDLSETRDVPVVKMARYQPKWDYKDVKTHTHTHIHIRERELSLKIFRVYYRLYGSRGEHGKYVIAETVGTADSGHVRAIVRLRENT